MVTHGRGCPLLPGALLVALGLGIACDGLITSQPQLNPSANENSNQVFKFNYTQRGLGSSSGNKWPLSSSGLISSTSITTTPSPGEQILRQQRQLVAKLKNRLANNISTSKVSTSNNNTTDHGKSNSNSTAISNGGRTKNETLTPLAASNSVKLSTAAETSDLGGRKLSRLQPLSKRQTDGSDLPPSNRRNEDPWFLDQQPPYPLQPYRFVYNIKGKNGQTEQYRQEVGDGKYLTGSYGYMLPDGIYRHVDYVADDRGFRAFIRTSEPGTANQNPANVVINSNPVLVSPGVDYAFPSSGAYAAAGERPSPLFDGGRQSSTSLYQNNPSMSNFNQPDYSSFANSAFADQPNELRRRPPGSIVNGGANNLSSLVGGALSQPLPYTSPLPPGSIVNNALRNFNSYTDSSPKSLLGVNPLRNFTSFTYAPPQTGSIVNNDLRNFNSFSSSLPTSTNYFSLRGGGNSGSLGPHNATKWSADDGRGGSAGSGNPPESADDNLGLSYKSIGSAQPLSSADLWRRQQEQRQYQETHGLLPLNRGLLQPQEPPLTAQAPSPTTLNRRPPIASTTFDSRAPSSDGSSRLSYDKPLADQRYHAGPHKLSYDNNHIFHPDSPYLTLERARNLAHLEQSNGFPRNHYLTSGGLTFGPGLLGTLIPTAPSAITGGGGGGGPSLSPLGGRSGESLRTHRVSKQEEEEHHHQAHHQSSHSSEQIGMGPPSITVTSKEHHSGTKSASGNEYESRQTIGSGDHLLPPPAPQFDHNLPTPVVGEAPPQPPSSLQAKFQSKPVESANDHNLFNIKGGGRGSLGLSRLQAPYTSSLSPQQSSEPRPPSPPEEPREPVEVSSTPLPPQLEPPQTGGDQQSGGDSIDEQQQQRVRSDVKGGGGDDHRATRPSSVGESSWLAGNHAGLAGNVGQPRFVYRPVREPESFRSAMMTGDFRSMQNTIGLPQPPRLAAGGSIGERTDESLGAGLNRADRIISARLNQIEALVGGSHGAPGDLPQARPATSETSESRRDEKPVQALSLLAGSHKPGKQQQQRAPEQRLSQTGEGAKDYDRKLSTGPLTKGNLGISGDPFNQLLLAGGVGNETFDARRLSSAAKLQAERVSELEKFQQRLRTQQLLLGGTGNGSGNNNFHSTSKQPHQKDAIQTSRARAVGELNSQVKYDEEPDVAFHSSAKIGGGDGINRSPRASTSGEASNQAVKHPAGNSTSNLGGQTNRQAAAAGLSDLAQKLQAWPSLIQATNNNNRTTNVDRASSPASSVIEANATGLKSKDSQDKLGDRSPGGATSGITQSGGLGQPKVFAHVKMNDTKPANTINLDFINSVTALSVDQMNPFAIASVNPALQQQQQSRHLGQVGPDGRPLLKRDGPEEVGAKSTDRILNTGAGRGSPAGGIATSNARYFSSPELLAALDYHERRDTSSQMRSLLPHGDGDISSDGDGARSESGTSRGNLQSGGKAQSSSWASNHRFSGAPYMMLSATSASALRTSAATAAMPSAHPLSPSSSVHGGSPSTQPARQDEFEVRDRSVQMDNHRFYEVVSSIAPVLNPRVQGDGYAAFRDAQLSIPAAS